MHPAAPPSSRSRPRILLVVAFVLTAANSTIFALLGALRDRYHIPTGQLGLVSGLGFVAGLITQVSIAGQADRGRARHLLVAGLVLSVVSNAVFALGSSLPAFVAGRVLTGVGLGCFLPAARALLASASENRLGEVLGRMASIELAGFTTGPVLGAALSEITLKLPFLVFGALAAIALVVVLPHLRHLPMSTRPPDSGTDTDPAPRRALSLDLLRLRPVRAAALLALANYLPVGVYDALWSPYLLDRGASTRFVGLSLTLYTVPFVLLAGWGGRTVDRLGPMRASMVAYLIVIPTTVVYGHLAAPIAIAGLALVDAIGQTIAVPGAQSAMAAACPPNRIAAGQGLAGASGLLGAGFSALVAPRVYASSGPGWVFGGAAAGVAILGTIAAVVGAPVLAAEARRRAALRRGGGGTDPPADPSPAPGRAELPR